MGLQMDDKAFQSALLESQVMLTKDYQKWNFETLQDLIEGPLLNPKRMEEAIKVSRFIRRLMWFFHPFSHRFSDMRRDSVCAIQTPSGHSAGHFNTGESTMGSTGMHSPDNLAFEP